MRLIHGPLSGVPAAASLVAIKVDRLRLAKRRWRGFAEDGLEFGFDLQAPLRNGDVFFFSESAVYVIEQQTESVVEMSCPEAPSLAARLGWLFGNLHFPLEICGDTLRVCDDPAVRQMLMREGFAFRLVEAVFQPASGGHTHGA
jgi:urease accessory protein